LNKRYLKRYPLPWQALLVILSIFVTKGMDLKQKYGLSVVGKIPAGFPESGFPHIPAIPGKSAGELFGATIAPSFLIALFVYVMSLSLGTFFAGKNGYKVNANQELTAIGVANTISSMCGAFICSASFSRTAVCHQLGAKTVSCSTVSCYTVLCFCVVSKVSANDAPSMLLWT
jgi:MFS superfamily sulfate permease-like transporter